MGLSKSSEDEKTPLPPKRTFTLEFLVGIFAIIGVGAAAYLSVNFTGLSLSGKGRYTITAEFDNISGLKKGASVEIAGVPIGEVVDIYLKDPSARVVMSIDKDIKIRDDDIVSIRTRGIIGDRYVKISRGASSDYIEPGEIITETESVVDIEDIIGKFVHSFGSAHQSD
ncbi:MAG: outer membrane lipid asymmetry maintenance protein MlaD [Candidatus Dadabacteria bacterium]|nr:MAG: outer membrane lipid asymmetry maintenance protein MlaD [Candidatus Dadabacteria bacterium]